MRRINEALLGKWKGIFSLFMLAAFILSSCSKPEPAVTPPVNAKSFIKIAASGEQRAEALRLSEVFRARVIDISPQSFVFELTGTPVKIDAFVEMMIPLGLVELSRTGVVAIGRGAEPT